MSVSPESPLDNLFSGLSTEELITEEQDHFTDSTAPSVLGKRTSPSRGAEDDDEDRESPGLGDEDFASHSNSATHPNPGTLRMEQVIRKMSKRLKLSDECVSLVEQFGLEHLLDVRLALLYGSTVAIRSDLAELLQNTGTTSFEVGEELQDNIKKYSRLILLSPSIYHYKGKVPKEYVTKIVVKYRFGMPLNVEANGHAWAKVTACIDHELTQARGRLKKILKTDAKSGDAPSRLTIYQLTRAMVGEESYKITLANGTRVAIMRQVHVKAPGGDFWDQVDKILDSIGALPDERRLKYLQAILQRDRRIYGVAPGATPTEFSGDTPAGEESLIQQRIEDIIEAPGGATVFQGPHDVSDT